MLQLRVVSHDVKVELKHQELREGHCIAQRLNRDAALHLAPAKPLAYNAVVRGSGSVVAEQAIVDCKSAAIEIQTENEKFLDDCLSMLQESGAVVIFSGGHLRPLHEHQVVERPPGLVRLFTEILKDSVMYLLLR